MMSALKPCLFALAALLALVTGSSTASPITHFQLSGLSPFTTSGSTDFLTVTALDASNLIVATYSGVAHFSSSDFAAILPSNYTFVAADSGTHTFSLDLFTLGLQTITVFDAVDASIFGTISTTVVAAVPEPGTYTLVLVAIGLLGFIVRRRWGIRDRLRTSASGRTETDVLPDSRHCSERLHWR
jgi:PEP-CTERM motif-containing protein